MKKLLLLTLASVQVGSLTAQANPELQRATARAFGDSIAANILLIKGTSAAEDPGEWRAYAKDLFRPREVVRILLSKSGAGWEASAEGASDKYLTSIPPRPIDFTRVRFRSSDARAAAAKAAVLAQATFVEVEYQLASNGSTGAPEWGLALRDDTGYEIGFCVVSAESGAVTYQDWTPRFAGKPTDASGGVDGERAAKSVKRAARKAWNWTEDARRETRNFFKELFR